MKTIRFEQIILFDKKTVNSVRHLQKKYGVRYLSYAGNIVQRVYHYYFGHPFRLKKEYRRYYKKEFYNFDAFLECRYGFPSEIRSKIDNYNLLCVNLEEKGDDLGECFSYSDCLKSLFWKFVGGVEDENTDRVCYEQLFY